MKKRNIAAAVLAAVLAAGTVSAVSFAEDDDRIREESQYGITLDKVTVDGEEKIAVKVSNIPKEAFTHEWEYEVKNEEKNWVETRKLSSISVTVEIGEKLLVFFPVNNEDKSRENKFVLVKGDNSFDVGHNVYLFWDTYIAQFEPELDSYAYSVTDDDKTFTYTVYLDVDDELVDTISDMDSTLVYTLARVKEHGTSIVSGDNNQGGRGSSGVFICVSSDGTIVDNPIFDDDGYLVENEGTSVYYKERVTITNNLNNSEASETETSDPTTSKPDTSESDTPSTPDEQTTLDVTLKDLDSEKGLEGEALETALFGDSDLSWDEVEKIVFTSDDLFSVEYKSEDGWRVLGDESETRASGDGIWNTEWTLNTADMAKDEKAAKIIAKDGTIDVTATIYIKADAETPDDSDTSDTSSDTSSDASSGTDNPTTGIAPAIAPIALAAGFVIAATKKRK